MLIEKEPIMEFIQDGLDNKGYGYTGVDILTEIEYAPTIEAEPKWISVRDRLPEKFENVLVFADGREFLLCHHDGDMWVANYDGEYIDYDYDITHWIPLPEAPKEE